MREPSGQPARGSGVAGGVRPPVARAGGLPLSRPTPARPGPARQPDPGHRGVVPGARPRVVGSSARGRRRFGDPRGLTVLGAVVLVLVVGVAAGTVDVLTGAGLRVVFALGFTAACAFAAYAVHREGLRATVVMPPLLYLALAVVAGAVDGGGRAGGWLQQQVAELAEALVYQAPVMFAATGAAAVIAGYRWWGTRT